MKRSPLAALLLLLTAATPLFAQGGPQFTEQVLEITPERVDAFFKAYAAEVAEAARIQPRVDSAEQRSSAWWQCSYDFGNGPEAKQLQSEMSAAGNAQKYDLWQQLSDSIAALQKKKCGADPGPQRDSLYTLLRTGPEAAANAAGGFQGRQYPILKERLESFLITCQYYDDAMQRLTAGRMVFAASEIEAMLARHAELAKALDRRVGTACNVAAKPVEPKFEVRLVVVERDTQLVPGDWAVGDVRLKATLPAGAAPPAQAPTNVVVRLSPALRLLRVQDAAPEPVAEKLGAPVTAFPDGTASSVAREKDAVPWNTEVEVEPWRRVHVVVAPETDNEMWEKVIRDGGEVALGEGLRAVVEYKLGERAGRAEVAAGVTDAAGMHWAIRFPDFGRLAGPDTSTAAAARDYNRSGDPHWSHPTDPTVKRLALRASRFLRSEWPAAGGDSLGYYGAAPDAADTVVDRLAAYVNAHLNPKADEGSLIPDVAYAKNNHIEPAFGFRIEHKAARAVPHICQEHSFLLTALARSLGFAAKEVNVALEVGLSWYQEAAAVVWAGGNWRFYDLFIGGQVHRDPKDYLAKWPRYDFWYGASSYPEKASRFNMYQMRMNVSDYWDYGGYGEAAEEYFYLELRSPVRALYTDASGRRVGAAGALTAADYFSTATPLDAPRGGSVVEIPGAYYFPPGLKVYPAAGEPESAKEIQEILLLPASPAEGRGRLTLVGTAAGPYQVQVGTLAGPAGGEAKAAPAVQAEGVIEAGQVRMYEVELVAGAPERPATIRLVEAAVPTEAAAAPAAGGATGAAAAGGTLVVQVPAKQAWTRTGIILRRGMEVELTASGAVEAAPPADARPYYHQVPPEGRTEKLPQFPEPNLPGLALVGRLGSGLVFLVGPEYTFRVGALEGEGELLLGINDDVVSDNAGAWTVQIKFRPGPPS